MGAEASTSKAPRASGSGNAAPNRSWGVAPSIRFRAISDNYATLEQVQEALRKEGLESSNLILGIDFTKSNEWTGKYSFGGKSLHHIGDQPNLYEEAVSIIAKTLSAFDDDGLIPCYGFGDSSTRDTSVFSFLPNEQPCVGLDAVLWRYRQLLPLVRLAGPTSFAPLIQHAMKVVADSGNQYHILVIVADGQVTRSSDTAPGTLSPQEHATVQAIVAASQFPLSIVMVGVGDGPWDVMKEFDDALPARAFDNFQFVNFTELAQGRGGDSARREAQFALKALMEIPEQFKIIQKLGLLGRHPPFRPQSRALNPPGPPPQPQPAPPPAAAYPPAVNYPAPVPFNPTPYIPPPAAVAAAAVAPRPSATATAGALLSSAAATAAGPDALYLCPITQDLMQDPVIAADGYSYDRPAIEEWLKKHDTSPMTNQHLPHKNLIPNHALRSHILEYMQRNGLK